MNAQTSTPNPSLQLQALATHLFGNALAVTAEKAAEALECHRSQIYRMVDHGQLEGISLSNGKRPGIRVTVLSILSFLQLGGAEQDELVSPAVRLAADQRSRQSVKDLL